MEETEGTNAVTVLIDKRDVSCICTDKTDAVDLRICRLGYRYFQYCRGLLSRRTTCAARSENAMVRPRVLARTSKTALSPMGDSYSIEIVLSSDPPDPSMV